jgi:hypothetical protein
MWWRIKAAIVTQTRNSRDKILCQINNDVVLVKPIIIRIVGFIDPGGVTFPPALNGNEVGYLFILWNDY